MAKTILEEAMEDAKLLKETAIENAKNVLVEAISPKIKEFVDSQLGESMYEENPAPEAPMGEAADEDDDDGDAEFDMGGDDDDAGEEAGDEQEDLQLLARLLKKLGVETNEVGDDMDMGDAVPAEGMAFESQDVAEGQEMDEAKNKDDEENVEEVVEFTNEDLKTALSEVLGDMKLKSEATVTKGFGAVQDATPKSAGGKGEKGLADEKSGEHQWSDETPPAAQDFTVKEYKQKIVAYKRAVDLLKNENAEYKKACAFLKRNLQEVNLFNSKLIYTNKLLHSAKLNNEQRLNVIETFDRAQSLREVELVYKSLSESFKIAGVLAESKQPQRPSSLKGPKGSRFSAPGSSVLNEGKEDGDSSAARRMQELAGLID